MTQTLAPVANRTHEIAERIFEALSQDVEPTADAIARAIGMDPLDLLKSSDLLQDLYRILELQSLMAMLQGLPRMRMIMMGPSTRDAVAAYRAVVNALAAVSGGKLETGHGARDIHDLVRMIQERPLRRHHDTRQRPASPPS